jgi:hypothetical protein
MIPGFVQKMSNFAPEQWFARYVVVCLYLGELNLSHSSGLLSFR